MKYFLITIILLFIISCSLEWESRERSYLRCLNSIKTSSKSKHQLEMTKVCNEMYIKNLEEKR